MNHRDANGGDGAPPSSRATRRAHGLEGAAPSAPTPAKPARKAPTHLPVVERHNGSIVVFVTVCTQGRKPVLTRPDAVDALRAARAKAHHWRVGRWVVMPDHIHLFCSPGVWPPEPLARWVSYWKSEASRHWPRPEEHPLWQRDFWDTQFRPGDHYGAKWRYVRENPVRAGLCANADAWPYQGEEHPVHWTE